MYQMPNGSARMDAVCASILVDQIASLPDRIERWHFAPEAPLARRSAVLARLFDMRLPLSFTAADGMVISRIIASETAPPTETA